MYKVEENRCIYLENDQILGIVTYPYVKENVVNINHTYVDPSLRGQGIANKLLINVFNYLKENNIKVICTCSYGVNWIEKHSEYDNLLYKETK